MIDTALSSGWSVIIDDAYIFCQLECFLLNKYFRSIESVKA
jgi:hypothetical protein